MSTWPAKRSLYTVLILSVVILCCTFSGQHIFEKKSQVITWDVYGYYLYLPATFIYHDTREYDFASGQIKQYNVSENLYQLNPVGNNVKAPAYTMGLAILWLPFFLLAHIFNLVWHHYPADGLSFPYQFAVIVSALFYAFTGMWFLRKALLHFFTDNVTALTLLCVVLGTNYFHYVCYESGMPHTLIFSLHAILFYLVVRWYQNPTAFFSIAIGITIALASLARPTELLAFSLFLLYGVGKPGSLKEKELFFRQHMGQLSIIIIAGFITILPQILYWHFNIGRWFYNGYVGHTFTFLHPHLYEGLLGFRKGWLIYTPMMVLALAGFFTKRIREAGLLLGVLIYFAINCYVVYSWDIWWYASSFGARALIQSYALLSIPLASFLFFAEDFWLPLRYLVYIFIFFCTGLNLFQDWQYRHRIIPLDGTTETYYRKVFGETQMPSKTLRRFLDIDEELPSGKTFTPHLLTGLDTSHEIKTVMLDGFSPVEIVRVTDANVKALSGAWIKEQLDLMCKTDLFTEWHEGRLVFEVSRNGQSIQWLGLRIQGLIETKQWTNVHSEFKLPLLQTGDQLKVYIWNQGPDTIYYKSIRLDEMREGQ